jgi:phage-related protein (TIGR01555 family)
MTHEAANEATLVKLDAWVKKTDSWANAVTGQGLLGRDKTKHDFFTAPRTFTTRELEELYRGDAIAKRIVDRQPNDMTRAGFEINISTLLQSDTETEDLDPEEANRVSAALQQRLRDINTRKSMKRALRWDRLYGAALAVMMIDDGHIEEMDQPVDLENIKEVISIRVLHRNQVTEGPPVTDPRSEHFGMPGSYRVAFSAEGKADEVIHADRVLRFQDVDLPENAKSRTGDSFGDSVFVRCWEALSDYQMAYRAVASLMADFAQAVWGIPNLHEMLIAKREDLIQRRIGLQDFVRSSQNAVMIDTALGETFERVATPLAGLADILDREAIRLSAATGMPMTLLFGTAPKGFAAEDSSGEANWDDDVSSAQDDNLEPQLTRLIRYIMLEQDGPTKGLEPETWSIAFNPLTQMTAEQRAGVEKTVAEKDAILIDTGVVMPSEVRSSRFTSDGFSQDTQLSADVTERMIEKEQKPPPEPPPMMIMGGQPGAPPKPDDDEE